MNSPSPKHVTRLIAELFDLTDPETMTTTQLNGLSTVLFNVLAHDYELLANVKGFISYHQKVEELRAKTPATTPVPNAKTPINTKRGN